MRYVGTTVFNNGVARLLAGRRSVSGSKTRAVPILIVLAVLISASTACAFASEPHDSVVRRSKEYVVELRPTWDAAVVVRRRECKVSSKIGLQGFGLCNFTLEQIEASTAGIWWYKNSLSFFDQCGNLLVIRLGHGKFIGVSLDDGRPVSKLPKALVEFSKRRSIELSLRLLKSKTPIERQTGAIVCGQEKVKRAIPLLKDLLKDNEYYTTNVPKEWTRVYYVRKAAKEALQSMNESVSNVIIEELDRPTKRGRIVPAEPESPSLLDRGGEAS